MNTRRELDAPPRMAQFRPHRPAEGGFHDPQKRQIASLEVLPSPPQRFASVDALRGFSMFCILGADSLAKGIQEMTADKGRVLSAIGEFIGTQFEHVPWAGARFYDLIFPMFIFITGAAIVFSLTRLVETKGRAAAHKRIIRRSIVLYILGIITYGGISQTWGDIRLGGVLQRIAICYLFASLIFLNMSFRGMVAVFIGLLAGYWVLMTFVPVPGVGAGSFEPGKNLANWIDANYLPGRKWEGTWDPEGILSTIPAVGTCLLGVFAGLLLKNPFLEAQAKAVWLAAAGLTLIAAGLLWGLQFPIIKYIWTSSFVLVAGGFAALMLAAFYQVIDIWDRKDWAAMFIWISASAITLYVFNMVYGFNVFAERLVGGDIARLADRWITPGTGRFLIAFVTLSLAVLTARFLYKRKIFLRV